MRIASKVQFLLLGVTLTALLGCGSSPVATSAQPPDVYAVGYESTGGLAKAVLWKNNVATTLDSGIYGARALAVTVANGHIYVAGDEGSAAAASVAVLWIDSVPTVLTNAGATGSASGVAVLGTDVYVVGSETTYNPAFGTYVTVAEYWKNGFPVILDDGIQGAGGSALVVNANANAIVINNADVYIAGSVGKQTETAPNTYADESVVTYWKNGTAVQLTSGLQYSETSSIAVEGGHVYVSGAQCLSFIPDCATATLWTDGTASSLAPELLSFASGVAILGGTVYAPINVTDTSGTTAFLATNGIAKALSSTDDSAANCVVTLGGDLYIGGAETGTAAYWKNGILTALSSVSGNSSVYAMAVVPGS
jgi:hypothetical protein